MSAKQLIELAEKANELLSRRNQIGIPSIKSLESEEKQKQFLNIIRVMTAHLPFIQEKLNNLKQETNENPEKPKRKRNTKPAE